MRIIVSGSLSLLIVPLLAVVLQAGPFDPGREEDVFLGIVGVPAEREKARDLFTERRLPPPPKGGLILTYVHRLSPCELLQPLDILTKIGTKTIRSGDDFGELLSSLTPGKPIRITYLRANPTARGLRWQEKTIEITPVTKQQFALKAVVEHRDDLLGITYLRHCDSPKAVDETSGLTLYQARGDDGGKTLYLRVHRVGPELLFSGGLVIKADEQIFRFPFGDLPPIKSGIDFKKDGSAIKWEYVDIKIDRSNEPLLAALTDCNEAVIRFQSSSEKLDIPVPEEQLDRLGILQMALRSK